MKKIVAFLTVLGVHCMALGQNRDNLYVDAGFSTPGGSVTFDRKMFTSSDLGIGFYSYNFYAIKYHNIRSATYLDFRHYWGRKRNMLFYMADLGMMYYSGHITDPAKASLTANSPLAAIGMGYGYRINKRAMGPYVSLRADGSGIEGFDYELPSPEARHYLFFDLEIVASIGFKI